MVPPDNASCTDAGPQSLRRSYLALFLFYYLVEGSNNGLLTVFVPIFLINSGIQGINEPFVLALATMVTIPFTVKLFWGIISDRFPIGRLGRRRPYISSMIILCGTFWLVLIGVLPYVHTLDLWILSFLGIMINIGASFSDTALDGLIMDVTPRAMLGRVEGATWACYSIGGIIGGTLGIMLWTILGDGAPVFVLFGIISIACGVIVWVVKEPPVPSRKFNFKTLGVLLGNKRYWSGYLFSMSTHLADNVVAMLFGLFVLIKMGIITTGTGGLSLYFDPNLFWYILVIQLCSAAGVTLSSVIYGRLADGIGRRKVLFIVVANMMAAIPLAGFFTIDFASGLVMAFFVGTALGGTSTIAMAYVATITQENKEATSTHFSLFTSFMNLGSSIGLGVFSAVSAAMLGAGIAPVTVYQVIFVVAPALALTCLAFSRHLPER